MLPQHYRLVNCGLTRSGEKNGIESLEVCNRLVRLTGDVTGQEGHVQPTPDRRPAFGDDEPKKRTLSVNSDTGEQVEPPGERSPAGPYAVPPHPWSGRAPSGASPCPDRWTPRFRKFYENHGLTSGVFSLRFNGKANDALRLSGQALHTGSWFKRAPGHSKKC